MKHLLKLIDLDDDDITDILNLADQLKYEKKNKLSKNTLRVKSLG
jgi:ornithine carbamoyltransferase